MLNIVHYLVLQKQKTKQFELICKHCGKLFIGYHATAKYCSLSCKQKHYRAQQKVDNTKDMKYYYKNI